MKANFSAWLGVMVLLIMPGVGVGQGPQSQSGISLEATSGIDLGWWLHNRGSSSPNVDNNLGWDRTDVSINVPLNVQLWYQHSRVSFGLGFGQNFYFEDRMEQFDDTPTRYRRYAIAETAVGIQQYYFSLEYLLFSHDRYGLSPVLSLGLFDVSTTHPDAADFDHKVFWSFGFTNTIEKGRLDFVIRPRLHGMKTALKSGGNANEDYRFKFFGFSLGARYDLFK